MTLTDEILAAQSQLLAINVEASTGAWDGPDIVSPVVLPGLYEVSSSGGIDQINAVATLKFWLLPSVAVNDPIQVFAGYNGEGEAIFKGEVASAPWTLPDGGGYALVCRDRLARARGGWPGPDEALAESTDETIIRHMLELYGLPSTIQDIDSDGWVLGIVDEVVLEAGKTAWELVAGIDAMSELRTYTNLLGVIRRKSVFAGLLAGSTWTLQETVNIVSINRTPDPMWPNMVQVAGLTYEELEVLGQASATNANIPTPPGDLMESAQSNFVETNAQAALAAQFVLNIKRMYAERFEIVTIGNPLIQPLDMIHMVVPSRGLLGDTIVENVAHSVSANQYLTTLRCIGLLNSTEGNTGGFPPVASFDLIIDYETILVLGVPTVKYFVSAVSTSTDSDGTIASQAWSAVGGTPASGTALDFLTVLPDLETALELSVTDNHGLVDIQTTALAALDTWPQTRPLLIAAASAGLLYYNKGQAVPLTYAMPSGQDCTAVPLFFENSNPHAGGSAGAIVRIDVLTDPLTLVATLAGGSVGAIFINSANELHILAGVGANLYRATDGATFTLLHTFAVAITDIQSSPTSLDEIRVCAGDYWISFDAATFTILVAKPSGATARMMATAGYGSAVCFTGGATSADAVKFEDPLMSVNWTGVVSPPTGIAAITPLLTTEGFIAAGTDCTFYRLLKSGLSFVATLIGTMGASGTMTDLMRDGDINQLAFGTSSEGTFKAALLPGGLTTYQLNTTPALQVGYGPLVLSYSSVIGFAFYLLPAAQVGAFDRLWLWNSGAYLSFALPHASWYWFNCAHNPNNPDQLLLLGNSVNSPWSAAPAGVIKAQDGASSPLYYSSTGGRSWTEVAIPDPVGGAAGREFRLSNVIWRTNNSWVLFGEYPSFGPRQVIWAGAAGAVTTSAITGISGWTDIVSVCRAADGDLLFVGLNFVNGLLYYLPLGTLIPIASPASTQVHAAAFVPPYGAAMNSTEVYGVGVHYTPNYRTTAASSRTSGGTLNEGPMAVMDDGKLYGISQADGVVVYGDIAAGASRTVVAVTPNSAVMFASPTGDYIVLQVPGPIGTAIVANVYDGTSWAAVPTPTGSFVEQFNRARLEVLSV